MAKARYTTKGNIKLTLTDAEAREVRLLIGSMSVDAQNHARLTTLHSTWKALSDLIDGGPYESCDIDWDHHQVIVDLFKYGTKGKK